MTKLARKFSQQMQIKKYPANSGKTMSINIAMCTIIDELIKTDWVI